MAAPAQSALHDVAEPGSQAEAFRRLAERRLDDAYRLATAILHNASDAEDATHDAFVLFVSAEPYFFVITHHPLGQREPGTMRKVATRVLEVLAGPGSRGTAHAPRRL